MKGSAYLRDDTVFIMGLAYLRDETVFIMALAYLRDETVFLKRQLTSGMRPYFRAAAILASSVSGYGPDESHKYT